MSDRAGDLVAERFAEFVVAQLAQHGDDTVVLRREGLVPVLTFLHDELDFAMPLDVTCVDRLAMGPRREDRTAPLNPGELTIEPLPPPDSVRPRFEVIYHLRSLTRPAVIRLKVLLDPDDVTVPTATGVYRGLTWFERADNQIQFSLRSIGDIDVSEIAKVYIGGGHKNAAGFRLPIGEGRELIDTILGRR